MLDIGTVLNNRYEIKEKIGAGGMSTVYKARCKKLQRYVAIKVLKEEFVKDEAFVKSFKAEALSAASLSHPNIVGIYDVGNDKGSHYIVMEYIEGKTLKELIVENGPYNTQKVLDYGIEIVSAIKHAHMEGIIHRDIKPQNILVTREGILKVTDFGIARAVDSSTIVSSGTAIGSVHYFSPEQAKGKYVDETSDLYSCGIVLFELATGRLPFQADSHVSVALKHINDDIPLPSMFNSNISNTLEQIILKATQKHVELRYSDAEEMITDMRRLSMNPSYTIPNPNIDMDQKTRLMTPEETDYIRENSNGDLEKEDIADEDDEEEEEVSKMYTVMVTVSGILAALVLVGIVTALAMPWLSKLTKPEVVVVPNVIGVNYDKAREELEEIGLKILLVDEQESDELTPDEIIDQSPKRDEIVPLKTEIEVIISKEMEEAEKEIVKVPDITNMDFTEAQIDLSNLGLKMQLEREFDDAVEAGIVISQYPLPEHDIGKGDTVDVLVSKGPKEKKIKIPSVINMDESTAISTLQNASLNVGEITHEHSDEFAKGRVIDQGTAIGSEVKMNSSVSIVVSEGKKQEEPEEQPENDKPPENTKPPENAKPPEKAVKNLTISIPSFLEEKSSYKVLVRLVKDGGSTETVYEGEIELEKFPITVSVEGRGKSVVETYIDNDRVYADPIDFGGSN